MTAAIRSKQNCRRIFAVALLGFAWEMFATTKAQAAQPIDRCRRPGRTDRPYAIDAADGATALETDSTRIISLAIDQNANPRVNLPGVTAGHHSLTHHGHRDDSVEQLKTIESA